MSNGMASILGCFVVASLLAVRLPRSEVTSYQQLMFDCIWYLNKIKHLIFITSLILLWAFLFVCLFVCVLLFLFFFFLSFPFATVVGLLPGFF